MDGVVVVFSGLFFVYSLMEILGLMPQELRSAGVTLPGLFSKYYGDPNVDFVMYQVRRSAITALVHSALPVLYCCGLSMLTSSAGMESSFHGYIGILWTVSIAVFMCGLVAVLFWYYDGWKNHPLAVQLARVGNPWRRVATSINLEFRDISKFVSELGGTTMVVTDSWIIQCNLHFIYILHQRDAVLNVASSDEHRFSLDGHSNQFITINVTSINKNFKSFDLRLNSYLYSQLRERLMSPIRTARNVVIQQSLSDRFVAAFAEQVEKNGVYIVPADSPRLEPCLGCSLALPEVKLQKLCSDDSESGSCRQCYCRPLWCLACMSKWFGAKQDKYRPEVWLASTAPCPMCRAPFCMLDIQRIRLLRDT